ncbi:phage tail tape measure protein [Streptomyces sp. NPDC058466]|uniref:phage tail tape measure protein n=1 Tax=Streptomyces sp. NPDC058466 TaxID=3346512 RepID=UPI0036481CDD
MSDVSLVFSLVAQDRTSAVLSSVTEKFKKVGAVAGAGAAAALGVGLAASLDTEAANDKLAAQLGLGSDEAAKVAKVSASVYRNAWGESTTDVNEAIKNVYLNIGDTSKAEGGLEGVTTKVMALADTFDQDLTASTYAAGQMVKTGMAPDIDSALDMLTVGFQNGADKSGDFLDTFNEYGTQFRKLGIDGPQAIGLISQGLKGGARDADLVADAFKEFGIRAIDGSTSTIDGFKSIGMNAEETAKKIAGGGPKANQALDETLDRLRAMKDPVEQNRVGVELFGTQWEDMGKAMMSLDPSKATDGLGKIGGAADKMVKQVGDNPKAALESFKRKAIGVFADVAGKIVMFVMDKIVPAVGKLIDTFKGIGDWLMGHKPILAGLIAVIGSIAAVIFVAMLPAMLAWIATTWASVAAFLAQAAAMFLAYLPIILIIAGIGLLVAGIFWLIQNWTMVWNGIKAVITAVWGFIRDQIFAPIGRFFTQTIPRWAGMMKDGVVTAWNWVKSRLLAAWNAIKAGLSAIGGFFTKTIPGWANTVKDRLVGAWTTAKSKVQSVVGGMLSWVRGKWDSFVGFFRGLPGKIGRATSGMFNGVKNAFRSAINWVIGKWNNFGFSIGGGSFMGVDIPKVSIGTPNIPYLAKGGIINRGGMAMVGERGPEVLSLPRGAGVTPLPVGGGGQAVVTIRFETDDAELKKRLRKMVKVEGRGSVVALLE